MYFELVGKLDVSLMLDNQSGEINSQKFCNQIADNDIKIGKYYTNAEVEKWRSYYLDMHPKQVLNEDVLPQSISENDIKSTFNRFFKPLSVDVCNLTIIDPYIFAKYTNVDLLFSVLLSNVGSKNIRFITNLSNADSSIQNDLENRLQTNGFIYSIVDRTDIHDRWWYTRIKGFSCGTSFNGIGYKTTMLSIFSDHDLNDIINQFGI